MHEQYGHFVFKTGFSSSQSPGEYHIIDVIDKFIMDVKCELVLGVAKIYI